VTSKHQLLRGDTPLEDQSSESEPLALNEYFSEAKTKEALRVLILQRFAKWLDDVLAEEKPLEGIAAELLSELEQGSGSETDGPTGNKHDHYSTWSEMTALTQEIKLQARAFKHLNEKVEPLTGLGESIDRVLEAHKKSLSDARHELISVIIDIRDKLIIGLRSANESRRSLDETRNSSWLNKIFKNKIARINHMLEIVNSLRKGYMLGLDRLDEALQQVGVQEIVCEGKLFDPRIMNAVDIEETVDAPEGMVLEVYRIGYMSDTEVHQPAQVKVARAPVKNTRD
jgi:hypothetical protein